MQHRRGELRRTSGTAQLVERRLRFRHESSQCGEVSSRDEVGGTRCNIHVHLTFKQRFVSISFVAYKVANR